MIAILQERLREAESLLSEVLRLAKHLEKKGQTFLTLGHENRIRKFLCLLPSEPVEVRKLELTAGPFKGPKRGLPIAHRQNDPLAGRPGLVVESAEVNAIAKDLGQLAKRHALRGCVLISFTDERVGVNSSGEPDRFGRAMEQLGDRLLAAIDDGKFNPTL